MKTNNVTINVNLGEGCENTDVIVQNPPQAPQFDNSRGQTDEILANVQSDDMEEALEKAGYGSVSVNPFRARPFDIPGEMGQIVGDGCIHLPTIFGKNRRHRNPNFLTVGESSSLGLVVSSKGVFAVELQRASGEGKELGEGDELKMSFRAANGQRVGGFSMIVEDRDPDGSIYCKKKEKDDKPKGKGPCCIIIQINIKVDGDVKVFNKE